MLEQARTEIDEIGVKITKTRENFNDLMKTYMLKPKKPNQQPEPKDFFDKWTSFSSEFKGKSFLSVTVNFETLVGKLCFQIHFHLLSV